jgi:hypothetical protein
MAGLIMLLAVKGARRGPLLPNSRALAAMFSLYSQLVFIFSIFYQAGEGINSLCSVKSK